MKTRSGIFSEEHENRRGVLKKMGAVGAFSIPAMASVKLSEAQVAASGKSPVSELDKTWTTYWSQNELFFGWPENVWSTNKDNWFAIWKLLS